MERGESWNGKQSQNGNEKTSEHRETFAQNPNVMKAYDEVIDQYLNKGYIRKVSVSEKQPDSKWYLPHFAIFKPNKATTMIRIVFYASAKYEGTSLNDKIYSDQCCNVNCLMFCCASDATPLP